MPRAYTAVHVAAVPDAAVETMPGGLQANYEQLAHFKRQLKPTCAHGSACSASPARSLGAACAPQQIQHHGRAGGSEAQRRLGHGVLARLQQCRCHRGVPTGGACSASCFHWCMMLPLMLAVRQTWLVCLPGCTHVAPRPSVCPAAAFSWCNFSPFLLFYHRSSGAAGTGHNRHCRAQCSLWHGHGLAALVGRGHVPRG